MPNHAHVVTHPALVTGKENCMGLPEGKGSLMFVGTEPQALEQGGMQGEEEILLSTNRP